MHRTPPEPPSLVVTAFRGLVVALRTADGVEQWRQEIGGSTLRIEIVANRVVVAGERIVILDYASGRVVGVIETGGAASTLLVVGSLAFVSQSGAMVGVDLAGGRVLWRNDLPGTGYGAAAIAVPGASTQADHDS